MRRPDRRLASGAFIRPEAIGLFPENGPQYSSRATSIALEAVAPRVLVIECAAPTEDVAPAPPVRREDFRRRQRDSVYAPSIERNPTRLRGALLKCVWPCNAETRSTDPGD